ncbi:MAG: FAD-dependent oxidoreductase [Clostridiaceae bacterium]|nr:FAD-dependent oxidoreductase [Clostridiaceae bacterium]
MNLRKKMICILMCVLTGAATIGCSSENKSEVKFKAGTYTGTAIGHSGPVKVETKFSDNKIESVKVVESSETPGIKDIINEKMPKKIVDNQSLEVDIVSGATSASEAVLNAVGDCAKQAGVDPQKLKIQRPKPNAGKTENMSADVVVVGAGAAGTAAALAAVDSGAKVLLLEKTSLPAGAGTMAGGMFTNGSSLQKAAGIPDSTEWLYDRYVENTNNRVNGNLARAIIDKSGSTVDWLIANGCNLNLADPGSGGQPAFVDHPKAFVGYTDGGYKAITNLQSSIEKKGGKILFDTTGEELIKNKQGEITGIVAHQIDGTKLNVSAKSVVIATGGYGGNAEMMKKNFGEKARLGAINSAKGEGIKMAWKAGAAESGNYVAQFFYLNGAPESDSMENANDIWTLGAYPLLWVNRDGKRFCNEECVFDYAKSGNALYEQPDGMAWVVFSQDTVDLVKQKGFVALADMYGRWKNNPQKFMEFNEPNDTEELNKFENTPHDLTPFLEEGVKTGEVVKGNTFEELGKKAGMDKQTFEATMKKYTEATANGKDTQFFKDPKYLYKVDKGPYYAMKVTTRVLGTIGGVKIDENIQAVDTKDKPIPGLWVAGADAGGMYGNSYTMFEGGTLGFAYNSGRIAGENAAKHALGK